MFIRNGEYLKPIQGGDVTSNIPIGSYSLGISITGPYLKATDFAEVKHKIYGDCERNVDRIYKTFESRPRNTGVMLKGEKGSGKTIMAKAISRKAISAKIPVIMINTYLDADQVCQFLSGLTQSCAVIFDEFEKTYSGEDDQNKFLTLLDGMLSSKHLFVFTLNHDWKVGDLLFDRPGRIFYVYNFDGLNEGQIREYCKDMLKNQAYVNDIVRISKTQSKFNFDMLAAVVEESNRYDESPKDFIRMLNIGQRDVKYSPNFRVVLNKNGVPVYTGSERYAFPNDYEFHACEYTKVDDTGKPLLDVNQGDDFHISFEVDKHLISYEWNKIVFCNGEYELTFTNDQKMPSKLMDYVF